MGAKKGNQNALGSKHSEATKAHYSALRKGKPQQGGVKNHTLESRQKIANALKGNDYAKGNVLSSKTRKKMSDSRKGKSFSESHKKAISISLMKLFENPANCPNWQGGLSFEPYSVDWTETLKRSIRQRDKYICQLCREKGNSVHHIDYDKKNCNPRNLITLCQSCHMKTNFNRKFWQKLFYEKDVSNYLKKFGGKRITDKQGVEWTQIDIKKEWGKEPVDAFGKIMLNPLFLGAGISAAAVIGANLLKKK